MHPVSKRISTPRSRRSISRRSGPLELRVFLDRSVIEVFANGRQCLTKRIYPDPQDLDAAFYCWGGAATLRVLDVWNMTPPA